MIVKKKPNLIVRHSTPIFRWSQVAGIVAILTKLFFNHAENNINHAEEMRTHDSELRNQIEVKNLLKQIIENQQSNKTDAIINIGSLNSKLSSIDDHIYDLNHH